jgi:hypothetical protein
MSRPHVVSVSPVALPTRAYAVGCPNASPAPQSVPRSRAASIALGNDATHTFGCKVPSEAQQRAAAFQAARRKCGERPHYPENRTPTVLKGLREADLRPTAKSTVSILPDIRASSLTKQEASAADRPQAEDSCPSIAQLAKRPWEVPRVDKELMKDPYMRAQGLHKNNSVLQSHVTKRMFEHKNFHDDGKVDFNTAWY